MCYRLAAKAAKNKPVVDVDHTAVHHEMPRANAARITGPNPRFQRIVEDATGHDERPYRAVAEIVCVTGSQTRFCPVTDVL